MGKVVLAPIRRPWRPLVGLAMLLVFAVLAVYFGSRRTKSLAEVAAASKPPPDSTLTAPVEQRRLEAKVTTRGTIGSAGTTDVDCYPGAGSQASGATRQVFTRRPAAPGSTISEGQVLAEVNGRPVLTLQGATPAFRELAPGLKGADVVQLQAALARMGFDPKEGDGVFGKGTQAAVTSWYRSLGYDAVGPSKEDSAQLEAARAAVAQAESGRREAQASLTRAAQPPSRIDVLQARIAVAEAQRQFDEARAAGADTALADLQLQLARTNLDAMNAPRNTSAEKAALQAADKALAEAKSMRDSVDSTVGTKLPFCEVVFVPSLPGVLDRPPEAGRSGQAGQGVQPDAGAAGGQSGQGAGGVQGSGGGTWARVASGQLVLLATVSSADESLLGVGIPASFGDGDAPRGTGRVTAIEQVTAGTTVQYRLTVTPDQPLPASALGQNVRVEVPVKSTSGDVLAVPLAAVSATPAGTVAVTKLTPAGEAEVVVEAGLSADGFVQVDPVPTGALQPGDRVVVGRLQ